MTILETAFGAAAAVGLLALALVGLFFLVAPRKLTRADVEEPYGDIPGAPHDRR
jgi:putative copper export protein